MSDLSKVGKMNDCRPQQSPFTRGQAYRSLRSIAKFQYKKDKDQVIPPATSLSPHGNPGKCGYLWRLSSKRLVYTPGWKRKYCVLSGEGYLYYYERESSQGAERGSGVIDLSCVMECVEAPLTDHKKATNVFILIAKQRGFFNQGRYYLSAETLFDMKDWVKRIKLVLTNMQEREVNKAGPKHREVDPIYEESMLSKQEINIPEPLYASIKEESIHRSNSMSTLPSLFRGQGKSDYLNRSMDECPMLDHNLTYNYSSSEDSLNESFAINFNQKSPRYADTSLGRKGERNKPNISLNYEYQGNNLNRRSPDPYAMSVGRNSTPTKSIESPDYIKKMYKDMDRVDQQLEMVARIESGRESVESTIYEENSVVTSGINNVIKINEDSLDMESKYKVAQLEKMIKKMSEESENLNTMVQQIQREASPSPGVEPYGVDYDMQKVLAKYNETMANIQSQALEIIKEIKKTQARVERSLNDAEKAKESFCLLKEEAEKLLVHLQAEVGKKNKGTDDFRSSQNTLRSQPHNQAYPYYAQTYPKARPSQSSKLCELDSDEHDSGNNSFDNKDNNEEYIDEKNTKPVPPVYAQVRKSHSDILRRKSMNTVPTNLSSGSIQSIQLSSPQISPVRQTMHLRSPQISPLRQSIQTSSPKTSPLRHSVQRSSPQISPIILDASRHSDVLAFRKEDSEKKFRPRRLDL